MPLCDMANHSVLLANVFNDWQPEGASCVDGPQREGGIVPKKKNNNRKLARWVDPGD